MNLLKSKTMKEFLEYSNKNENIIAIILFGSYANRTQKPTSDIDICLFLKKNTKLHKIHYPLIDEGFDIHSFDKLPLELKFNIFSKGKIIHCKNKLEFCKIRKAFLHFYRGNYYFLNKNMEKFIKNV